METMYVWIYIYLVSTTYYGHPDGRVNKNWIAIAPFVVRRTSVQRKSFNSIFADISLAKSRSSLILHYCKCIKKNYYRVVVARFFSPFFPFGCYFMFHSIFHISIESGIIVNESGIIENRFYFLSFIWEYTIYYTTRDFCTDVRPI